MFNNLFKFKYFKNEKDLPNNNNIGINYIGNITDIINIFSKRFNSFTNRNSHTHNTDRYLFILKKTRRFFRDYAEHSKKSVRIGLNGYGNLDYLGSINDFTITYPKDPSVEDIGLFNNHIKKGYPDKWQLKETSIDKSTKQLKEMDEIIKKFNIKIRQIIKSNSFFKDSSIKSHENSNSKYYPNIFLEMFKEIQNKKSRELFIVNVDKKTSIYFKSDSLNTSDTIMSMNSSDYEHGRSFAIIDKILEDDELKKLVNKFNTKLVSFQNIKEGKDFRDFVTTLEENIINQNTGELKGVCKHCQLKKVIYNWFISFP